MKTLWRPFSLFSWRKRGP